MHIERLTALAALLDVTPPHSFDLGHWHCGTTACAVGTAALHPGFNAQGLSLRQWAGTIWVPVYDRDARSASVTSWDAVTGFFELSFVQARYLFTEGAYPDEASKPADVATRIREFIQGNQP